MPLRTLGTRAARQDRQSRAIAGLDGASLFLTEVLSCTAHLGVMQVGVPLRGVFDAVAVTAGGHPAYGPRAVGAVYPPHTIVVCYLPPDSPIAYVLGAVPPATVSGAWNMVPDWLVPASSSGIGFDRVHWGAAAPKTGPSFGFNFAGGRPVDALPGDHGYLNELGVGYGMGRFVSWLRASHFCGVEAFWLDNLLRLLGHNLEIMTSSSERRAYNDEGEFSELYRWGAYPWETLGRLTPGADFTKEEEDGVWDPENPRTGREPLDEDQAGFWRVQEFRGYLGDLRRTIVSVPPAAERSGAAGTAVRLSADLTFPGVLDVGFSADGRYHVRAARGVLLEKTLLLPVPKERFVPDDPDGDNSTNYRAAGYFGDGPPDHVREEPEWPEDHAAVRSALAWERHALLYSYLNNLTLLRHQKDWHLPTEVGVLEAWGLERAVYVPLTEVSAESFWMPLPKSTTHDVDHRETARYYAGRAVVSIDETGGILLEDAYGSQIRMEGGNIFLAARNDIVLQAGRGVQLWAPQDLILKAGRSADLTASQGDVRVKAQGNLMMAAAEKGVLIEARDDGSDPQWDQVGDQVESRGVVLRAAKSTVAAYGRDVYLRTGVDGPPGGLHLDAGEGRGDVHIQGKTVTQRGEQRVQAIVGASGDGSNTASLDLTADAAVLGGPRLQKFVVGAAETILSHEAHPRPALFVGGDAFINSGLWVEGLAAVRHHLLAGAQIVGQSGLHIKGGGLFTGPVLAKQFAADVGAPFIGGTADDARAEDMLPPEHPERGKELGDAAATAARERLLEQRREDNGLVEQLHEELHAENSRFGGAAMLRKAAFSFRTAEQYGTDRDDFVWFEARWQELNRKVFEEDRTWREEVMRAPHDNQPGTPYPGYDVWFRKRALRRWPSKLDDPVTGLPKARSAEDRDYPELESVTFAEGYNVTIQTEQNSKPDDSG